MARCDQGESTGPNSPPSISGARRPSSPPTHPVPPPRDARAIFISGPLRRNQRSRPVEISALRRNHGPTRRNQCAPLKAVSRPVEPDAHTLYGPFVQPRSTAHHPRQTRTRTRFTLFMPHPPPHDRPSGTKRRRQPAIQTVPTTAVRSLPFRELVLRVRRGLGSWVSRRNRRKHKRDRPTATGQSCCGWSSAWSGCRRRSSRGCRH
jgi:hypothetical protein